MGFRQAEGWKRWKRCPTDVLKVYHNGMVFKVIHGELLEGGMLFVMVDVENNKFVRTLDLDLSFLIET